MITFEEASHTYLLQTDKGVVPVPSVTEILDGNSFYTPGAADRGTRIHQEIVAGTGCDDVSDEIRPWMEAYWEWVLEWQVVPLVTETVIYSQKYCYAGRFDMIAETPKGVFLVDFKTGAVPSWAPYQTAAYAHAIAENSIGLPASQFVRHGKQLILKRMVLELAPGCFRVRIHRQFETDFAHFLRARQAFGSVHA